MDRRTAILLSAAAGLMAIIMLFPGQFAPSLMTKELCEDSEGIWNECGSLCTGEPPGTVCPAVCVPTCECLSGFQCPPGYYCSLSNGTGACKPVTNH